jgi:3-hydroxyisobutyrate dehydrogenase-like beta-hydroxyacid dehydrogenase
MSHVQWEIGIVGLGNMGSAIAESILNGGFSAHVYDVNPEAVSRLKSLGARGVANPRELAERCNVILTSLPNGKIVRDVYLGEAGIVSVVKPDTILVELSTVDADTVRNLDPLLTARSAILLDVPVSGSPNEARQGKLKLITSGDQNALERIDPILRCFGETVQHVGPPGNAKIVKIVNNLMTMGNVLVAAEAFTVGVKAGIDPDLLFDVINQSGGRSHHFGKRFPNALARNFNPGFTVDMAEKDVGLALELSKSVDLPAPVAGLVQQMYKIAMTEGMAREDIVAMLKLYERWGHMEVKGSAANEEKTVKDGLLQG